MTITDHLRHLWHLARRVPFAAWLWWTLDLSIADAWAAARDDDWARRKHSPTQQEQRK